MSESETVKPRRATADMVARTANVSRVAVSRAFNPHASIKPEPFGRVMIEAMALGRPVVAPREAGPLAIVVDGETGLLVTPRDVDGLTAALGALVADPARRRAMGRAARARVDAVFDIRHHVRAVEDLCDEVLGRSAGRTAGRAVA